MKIRYGCPVQSTIQALAGKWKVQIVWHLSFGPRRFAELRKKLAKISEKVLAQQLRELTADKILVRLASTSVPARVTYSLNEEGEKLVPLLQGLCDWGSLHFGIKPTLTRPPKSSIITST